MPEHLKGGGISPRTVWWIVALLSGAILLYALMSTHQHGVAKAELQTQKEAHTYAVLLEDRFEQLEHLMRQGGEAYLSDPVQMQNPVTALFRFGAASHPEVTRLALLAPTGTPLIDSYPSPLEGPGAHLPEAPIQAPARFITPPFESPLEGESLRQVGFVYQVRHQEAAAVAVAHLRLDVLSRSLSRLAEPGLPVLLARTNGEVLLHLSDGAALQPGEQMALLKEQSPLTQPLTRIFEAPHSHQLYIGTAHPLSSEYGLVVASAIPHAEALASWRLWAPVAALLWALLAAAGYLFARRLDRALYQRNRSEALYRSLFRNISDPILMIRLQGDRLRCKEANPALSRMLGAEAATLSGRDIAQLDPIGPELVRHCQAAIEQRDSLTYEQQFALDERARTWMVVLNPILDRQKRVYMVVAVCRDITEQKQHEDLLERFNEQLALHVESEVQRRMALEQEQEKSRKLLIQQSKMAELGNMIGTIAHQWKQPLNAIGLGAQAMAMDAQMGELDAQRAQEGADRIMDHVHFMSQTMDEFRSFYKPDRQKERFELRPSLDRVIRLLEPTLQKASIALAIRADEGVRLQGFANEFQQVILNLLNNAIDALIQREVSEPRITIEVQSDGSQSVVRVQDNGGGIDEALLPDAIFDPFVSTKGEKGTGVGLSLSKTIIEERMGGRLIALNRQGGAALEVWLPTE